MLFEEINRNKFRCICKINPGDQIEFFTSSERLVKETEIRINGEHSIPFTVVYAMPYINNVRYLIKDIPDKNKIQAMSIIVGSTQRISEFSPNDNYFPEILRSLRNYNFKYAMSLYLRKDSIDKCGIIKSIIKK